VRSRRRTDGPPPHVPVSALGVETTKPAGSASPKPMPVSDVVVFGLLIVKLSEVEAPSAILAAPKDFRTVGGATTITLAFEVFPAPAFAEVTVTLLFCTPAAIPSKFTVNVQEPLTASVAPARPTEEEPATAVMAPPPHDPVRPLGAETCSPAGKASVNAMPVRGMVFNTGLLIVNANVVEPASAILGAPNTLVMTGGLATDKFAVPVFPVPPLVEVTELVVLV
jgi:hypothetical protein